jgi:hypothetical protein
VIKTCALDGCSVTWEHDGTRRKYCCTGHARYGTNHSPQSVARRRAYNAEWQRENRDRVLAYARSYRERNRDSILAYQRAHRAAQRNTD